VRLAWRESLHECSNCQRPFPGNQLDRRMWCPDCRKVVIRRATLVAQAVGLLTALSLALWIYILLGPSPRFLVAYAIMVVAAYFFLFKLTQRVAFEIIRARGVPPPPEAEDHG
jgi:DNA-directed RNA polymerase subunit RPC12/RpoP